MTEILDHLLQAAALALTALGGLAIRRLADWLRLRADSEVRLYLTAALDRAVEYGLAEARRRLRGEATLVVGQGTGVKETVLAVELARDYAQQRVPDALARFGVDTAALDQLIRARLPRPPAVPFGG